MTLSHSEIEDLTGRIIGAGIEVHKHLGAGLLESTYDDCLCWELEQAGIRIRRQPLIAVLYKGRRLRSCYRPDIVVEDKVVIEVKAAERLADAHKAQLLTYLKHTDLKVGLLFNFNTRRLIDGIVRISN